MKNRRIKELQLGELNTNCSYCAATRPTVLPPQDTARDKEGKRGEKERDFDKDMPIPPKRTTLDERKANKRLDNRVPAEKINEEFR